MKIFNKGIIIFLSLVILFVFSGIGVLAVPKPAKAFLLVEDWKKTIENILLAIWKFAIYPLLQKIVITAVTKGDWFLTEEELKKWAIQDLAFQSANAVLTQISGVSLCAKINQNIKLALSKMAAGLTKYTPSCTYDSSELVGLLNMDPEKRSDTLRKKLFQSISITTSGGNNDIGLTFEAAVQVMDKTAKKNKNAKDELSLNGLLTTRDCSCNEKAIKKMGAPVDISVMCDKDKKFLKKEWQANFCRKTAIDGQLAATIKKNGGVAGDQFGQTLKSQVLLDLIVLGKMTISSAIETHIMTPLQKWLAKHLLSDQPALAPSYSRSGENQIIEFPMESYVTGEQPAPPDLFPEETP